MPAPPGMSDSEYRKLKEVEKEKKALRNAKKEYNSKYGRGYDPTADVEAMDTEEVERGWMKSGEWAPSWGLVEFDGDACLKNVSKAGKEKDGFFAPAGTTLPLGAAIPEMTVLKYGGYFPAGTSFPGGVMVPLHARMVNLLPAATTDPADPWTSESLCVVHVPGLLVVMPAGV